MSVIKERQLLPVISDNRETFGGNLSQVSELNSGFGVADLVLFNLNKEVIHNRIVHNISPIESYDLVRVLIELNNIKSELISLTFLRKAFPQVDKSRDKIIHFLVENGFLIPKDVKMKNFRKGRSYKIGLQEVIAIEAKVSNWKRGLYQAYRYKEYANKSYLALYSKYVHRALKYKTDFIRFNVGLVEVEASTIKVLLHPQREDVKYNIYSALVFEKLFKAEKDFSPVA